MNFRNGLFPRCMGIYILCVFVLVGVFVCVSMSVSVCVSLLKVPVLLMHQRAKYYGWMWIVFMSPSWFHQERVWVRLS